MYATISTNAILSLFLSFFYALKYFKHFICNCISDSLKTFSVVPELKLSIGANIQPDAIKEGTDVFFECTVKSNPSVNEVKWRFEGYPLYGNTSAGIIVSNYSLVLQKVRKDHRGNYQCAALNSEGEGRSEEVMLKVKCEFLKVLLFFTG